MDVKVGDVVLVRAVVSASGEALATIKVQDDDDKVLVIPITAIDSITEPAVPTFDVGDRVQDSMGLKFEVIMAPRELEDGRVVVGLWHETNGVDWNYVDRLSRITE